MKVPYLILMLAVPASADAFEQALPGSACLAEDGGDQASLEYQDNDYYGGGSLINVSGGDLNVVCPLVADTVYPAGWPFTNESYLEYLEVSVYTPAGDEVTCYLYVCPRNGSYCSSPDDTATTDDDYFDELVLGDWEWATGYCAAFRCSRGRREGRRRFAASSRRIGGAGAAASVSTARSDDRAARRPDDAGRVGSEGTSGAGASQPRRRDRPSGRALRRHSGCLRQGAGRRRVGGRDRGNDR